MEFLKNLDWLPLLVSTVVGILLDKIIRAIVNYKSTSASAYIGKYYAYHFATIGSGEISEYELVIHRKINGSIGVKKRALYPVENQFSYKGELKVKGRHIYILLEGVDSEENVYYIISEPISRKINRIIGLVLALNMKKNPWAGLQLISKQRLSLAQAKDILKIDSAIVAEEMID
jgi:hypothetical protein